MLHAISALVLAAESAEESSKTAFYICGGLFAAWAVVLSVIGMTRGTFPTTTGARNGVIGVSAVIMAAAMATAVITA